MRVTIKKGSEETMVTTKNGIQCFASLFKHTNLDNSAEKELFDFVYDSNPDIFIIIED